MCDTTPGRYTRTMSDTIDLTGRHFGSLVALTRMIKTGRFPRELWLCQCACGITPIIEQAALLDERATACGPCSHAETVRQAARRVIHDGSTTKVCTGCQGEPKLLTTFAYNSNKCRRCVAARTRTWRARKKANV